VYITLLSSFLDVSTMGAPDANILARFVLHNLQHYFWYLALKQVGVLDIP
jgi:hypothetical protein